MKEGEGRRAVGVVEEEVDLVDWMRCGRGKDGGEGAWVGEEWVVRC